MRIRLIFVHIAAFLVLFSPGSFSQNKTVPQTRSQKKPAPAAQQHRQQQPAKQNTTKPASTTVIKFTPEQIEGFKDQCSQLIRFFEGTLNFLADKGNLVKEKQVIINQSYEKMFWDSKVQVEDDLDDKRLVTLYKDVQGYLSDVDFFFRRATFKYSVQDVSVMTNDLGQTYFKVTANRNIAGITVNNDSVNSNKVRYFEINYDESKEQLKIVSIYTTKYEVKDELRDWWNNLSQNWKDIFGKEVVIDSVLHLNQVATFHDSTGLVNGADRKIDPEKIYRLLSQIVNQKQITLPGSSGITDLGPLTRLSSLTEVILSGVQVIDLMPLRNLNQLESLDISGTKVSSLDPLRYDNNIKSLRLKNSAITNIDLVSGFPLLEVLDISNTAVKDLAPLKDLTGLKDLRFSGTQVADIKPLAGLTNAEILYCQDIPASDFTPLKDLNKLQLVFLDNTKISSLAAFENLASVKKIYCDKTSVSREDAIDFMKRHPSVTVIFASEELMKWWTGIPGEWKKVFAQYLQNGEKSTSEELHRLTTIDSINIRGRVSIYSLDPVSVFRELRYLECSSTAVSSLEPLRNLNELRIINLSNTKITGVEPLSSLKNLETLTLDNTQVIDINPLKGLKLKFIFADNSRVSLAAANDFMDQVPGCLVVSQTYENNDWWKDLSREWKDAFLKQMNLHGEPDRIQLQQITGLESLVISDNPQIFSLLPVLHLKRLKEIQFSDMKVTSLEPLGQMKKLRAIRCMKNPISDLAPVSGLTGLTELDFSNTQVEDLFPLENLKSLEILKFSGTPVKTLKYLKGLVHLKVVELYSTRISSLDDLEPMFALKSLKIFNTKISERKVAKFKTTHPGCDIVFY